MSEDKGTKRSKEEEDGSDSDGWVGPLPSEAAEVAESQPKKKRKVLEHEAIYLDNLPLCDTYEKSYMHRDLITHILVTKTDFVVSGSCDGHIKFWKKTEGHIEFVKHYRSHLGK